MNNDNAASTTPVGENMSLLNGMAAHEMSVSAHSPQQQLEGLQTLQRILVVEDDPTLATLEAEVLAAHGYTVFTVNNGELAITTLRRSIPDLVVLDLELTGTISGWDVFQVLRTFTNIPVLMTTSAATPVRKYIRSSGETRFTLDHLPKPYPMQIFLKRIKRMLSILPQ